MPAQKKNQTGSARIATALAPITGENYLGDPQVVDRLLRNFANHCIQRRTTMLDKREQSAAMDIADATVLANILLGQNPSYPPRKGWDNPDVISHWVFEELKPPVAGSPETIIRNAIVTYLMKMYEVMVTYEDAADEDMQMVVDGLVQEFTKLLMGDSEWNKE